MKLNSNFVDLYFTITYTQLSVDESHPLLKGPAEPLMKYGVPVEPLQKTISKVTKVYLNPRVAVCDMQRISPTKLHHQVTDLITSLNNSDDDEGPLQKR